jgi:tetratricopeptide (TPR) repeat protein
LFDQGRISDILEILAGKEDLSSQEALILGKIYFRQGDYDRALSLLSQLLASPDRDGEASLYLAWLYLNLRKNEEVANLFLDEARSKLSPEEFERLKRELNL